VTPINPTTGYIRTPVQPLPLNPDLDRGKPYYSMLQHQFHHNLLPWQNALFGLIQKVGSTNKLKCLLQSECPVMIVSDASVQKNGQSGFAWIIAHAHILLWRGTGLAPGPVDDTYSRHAEAYGLLATITFLCFYVNCYDNQIPIQTSQCYCDNSGVITNLTKMRNV